MAGSVLWTVIPTAIAMVWIGIRLFVDWRRLRARWYTGCCLECGFDLRAAPDRCPECGGAVPDPVRRQILQLEASLIPPPT